MLKNFIKDNYGSRKGLLYYQWDGLISWLGFYQYKLPDDEAIERVVFVCQGNICRSALAEAVFRRYSSLETASLGLNTSTGKPANERMIKAAKIKANIDLKRHRTTCLHDFHHRGSDLFVCMELHHINILRKLGYENPCVLLGAFGDTKLPRINDPYSANDRFMEKTVDDIIYHATYLAKNFSGGP